MWRKLSDDDKSRQILFPSYSLDRKTVKLIELHVINTDYNWESSINCWPYKSMQTQTFYVYLKPVLFQIFLVSHKTIKIYQKIEFWKLIF